MRINNKEVSVDDAIAYADLDNVLIKYKNNDILLNNYQVSILKRNGIDYNSFANISHLLFRIEEVLNIEYDEELDIVASQLSELHYYKDTKK